MQVHMVLGTLKQYSISKKARTDIVRRDIDETASDGHRIKLSSNDVRRKDG